jgi:hypothetical protein
MTRFPSRPVLLVAGLLLLPGLARGVFATQDSSASETETRIDLTLDDASARLGDRVLHHPVRESDLVALLGNPERSRYRLRWPGRGVLAVPAALEGEIEELVFVLCEGAPEAARVGLFTGKVRLDGAELSCAPSHDEALAALPDDFSQTEELDALAHARRGALELVVSVSSWDGLLSISLGFLDPDDLEPVEPEVRDENPPFD